MITLMIGYLKRHKTSTAVFLISILAWILYIIDFGNSGHWLIVCAITIFVLIMILGQTEDRVDRLQKALDKFKI